MRQSTQSTPAVNPIVARKPHPPTTGTARWAIIIDPAQRQGLSVGVLAVTVKGVETRYGVVELHCPESGEPTGTIRLEKFGGKDEVYLIDMTTGSCTCPDYKYNGGVRCKHYAALKAASAALKRREQPAASVGA